MDKTLEQLTALFDDVNDGCVYAAIGQWCQLMSQYAGIPEPDEIDIPSTTDIDILWNNGTESRHCIHVGLDMQGSQPFVINVEITVFGLRADISALAYNLQRRLVTGKSLLDEIRENQGGV